VFWDLPDTVHLHFEAAESILQCVNPDLASGPGLSFVAGEILAELLDVKAAFQFNRLNRRWTVSELPDPD
jgi:hypothetical protein